VSSIAFIVFSIEHSERLGSNTSDHGEFDFTALAGDDVREIFISSPATHQWNDKQILIWSVACASSVQGYIGARFSVNQATDIAPVHTLSRKSIIQENGSLRGPSEVGIEAA